MRSSPWKSYDLIWLFGHFPERTLSDVISLGSKIDGVVDGESMLISVQGANLRKEACDFSLDPNIGAAEIYRKISEFRDHLVRDLYAHLRDGVTASPLGPLVRKIRALRRTGRRK